MAIIGFRPTKSTSKLAAALATEYKADAATSFENNLILKWYPERVVKNTGHIRSLLELGVGHGYTAELFNKYCDRHVKIHQS